MKFWIDGEWNSFKGDLISMALVCEDGSEWYEVLGCKKPDPWVALHVMPHLAKTAVSLLQMQASLVGYLHKYTRIEIIADWPEDIERFCSLLITGPGEMLPIGPRIHFTIDRMLNSEASAIPHQALADARAMQSFPPTSAGDK